MTTYLDKEAVLKAANLSFYVPDISFVKRIERGEFDLKLLSACAECQKKHEEVLAAKDAEINALKSMLDDARCNSGYAMYQLLREQKEAAEKEVARLNTGYRQLQQKRDEVATGREKALNRIIELEKLCDMQKATIDAQGKALREARDIIERLTTALYNYEQDVMDFDFPPPSGHRNMMELAERVLSLIKSAQKAPEPELFICPAAGRIPECAFCGGTQHHKHTVDCDKNVVKGCPRCVPIKPSIPQPIIDTPPKTFEEARERERGACLGKEDSSFLRERCPNPSKKSSVPTSGPGTSPEGAIVLQPVNVQQAHTQQIEAIQDRLDTSERILENNFRVIDKRLSELDKLTHPGMAKGIGDLTLRVDNLEDSCAYDHEEIYYGKIRIGELETALKALQDKISASQKSASDPCTLCKLDAPFCTTCIHTHYRRVP